MGNAGNHHVLEYDEALYFGDSKYASLIRFYLYLERTISIEWFIRQLDSSSESMIHFMHAIDSGLPFFKPDEFESRIRQTVTTQNHQAFNKFSNDIFYDKVVSLRNKRNIAENVQSLGLIINNFIKEFKSTKADYQQEFLH